MLLAVFRSDFYSTAATVVPVLLLALGWSSEEWLRAQVYTWRRHASAEERLLLADPEDTTWRAAFGSVFWWYLALALLLVNVLGVAAEVVAVIALANGRSNPGLGFVTTVLVVLVLAVGASAVARFVTALRKEA